MNNTHPKCFSHSALDWLCLAAIFWIWSCSMRLLVSLLRIRAMPVAVSFWDRAVAVAELIADGCRVVNEIVLVRLMALLVDRWDTEW